MAVSEIQAAKDGPYRMAGGVITVTDAQGNTRVVERARVSLCRCGHSADKPFCDGSHRTCGFVADEVTIRWQE